MSTFQNIVAISGIIFGLFLIWNIVRINKLPDETSKSNHKIALDPRKTHYDISINSDKGRFWVNIHERAAKASFFLFVTALVAFLIGFFV